MECGSEKRVFWNSDTVLYTVFSLQLQWTPCTCMCMECGEDPEKGN
jgi:hypothetical protein